MRTSEFETVFSRNGFMKACFKGAYALDEVPQEIQEETFVVVNTENADQSGSHWFLIGLHE